MNERNDVVRFAWREALFTASQRRLDQISFSLPELGSRGKPGASPNWDYLVEKHGQPLPVIGGPRADRRGNDGGEGCLSPQAVHPRVTRRAPPPGAGAYPCLDSIKLR